MCVVSNIGDQIGGVPWKNPYNPLDPYRPEKETAPTEPWTWPIVTPDTQPVITIPEAPEAPALDADSELVGLQVKAVVEWLKKIDKILIAARDFDEATGQPDCETAEKMQNLKELAEAFGVEMEFFS